MADLEPIGEAIWLAEGEIVSFYGFPYPTRCVIVRLASGALWVWSPIALTDELNTEISTLGKVEHLVSPNRIHHLYLQDWLHVHPQAKLWGPASTIGKRKDLRFEAPLENDAPAAWSGEIEQFHFTGSPALDEVVFFHRPSRTAIFADLSENFSAHFLNEHWRGWQRTIARLWKITEPWGLAPLELRLSWWHRADARRKRDALIACHPARVVMAHGEWQRQDGTTYLTRVLAWLG